MIKLLRPEEVWQPKLGAPRGNHNAFKNGRRTAALRAWRKRVAAWRRRAKAAVKAVEELR